jgi:glyoxylate/hydroxypyruvate reductase A
MSGARAVFVYKADPVRGAEWARWFAEKAPAIEFAQWPWTGDPERVRYLAAWEPPADLSIFPQLELLFSVGAGVDQFDFSRIPHSLPVIRMVEEGIIGGMVEYVTLAVLAIHRHWQRYGEQQRAGVWQAQRVMPPSSRRIGVLGLGVLAQAVLAGLRPFGFPCAGWSRSAHTIDGVACFAGAEQLPAFLARCDVLICLLPLTASTEGILDRSVFHALPDGAALINVGRGGHLNEADLLAALDSGRLASATLDVVAAEPLPADHPFWAHPRVTLTPHIASMTQPETAVDAVLANLRRHAGGQPLHGLVARDQGY